MVNTANILPAILNDTRCLAFAAALDRSLSLEPWQACPLKLEHASDEVLWELARQFGVAGPLYQAMKTRSQKERLVEMALRLQRKRCTPWAVEEVMRLLGYTDAKVLDRVGGTLRYDAETNHAGHYMFDGGVNDVWLNRYRGDIEHQGDYIFDAIKRRSTMEWYQYKIRLYMAGDSRALTDDDRAQAALLAEDWAPLHCELIGWEARHMLESQVDDPASAAGAVYRVVLMGSGYTSQIIREHWVQPLDDGSRIVRWRLRPDDVTVPDVSSVVLASIGGTKLDSRTVPLITAAPNVTIEGYWRFYD